MHIVHTLLVFGAAQASTAWAGPPAANAAWTAESNQAGAELSSVASAGDVDGDGFDDVVVGAYAYSDGQNEEGAAWVYLGSPTGLALTEAWFDAPANQVSAWFGVAVASAGDVNGDGFDDVVIGGLFYSHGQSLEGQAWLYLGSALGLAVDPIWTADSDEPGSVFGTSVASAGDVNGDGFDDVIVGAPYFERLDAVGGRAFLYLGSATGLGLTPVWAVGPEQADVWFGQSVASAGDVNGDGFDDVIVGAPMYDGAQIDGGKVFVYLGSPTGPALSSDWSAEGDQDGAFFGDAVASAGDVNADGFDDVVVGAPYYDEGFLPDAGRAYVYLGSAGGLADTPVWSATSSQYAAHFGFSVAGAGDREGDTFDDVVVGSPGEEQGQAYEGVVRVYGGTFEGVTALPVWTQQGATPSLAFGQAVASAGDVDGDSFPDLLVGAPNFSGGQEWEGRVYLFPGACGDLPDADADGVGDACDLCPGFIDALNEDNDEFPDGCDPCPSSSLANQTVDQDGDGAGAACDCDDDDPTSYPGAPQLCDGVDNTCELRSRPDELDLDGDGVWPCQGDCDDHDASRWPGAPQLCDGVDNTCSGTPEEDFEIDCEPDSAGGAGCGCAASRPTEGVAWPVVLLALARRRRQRR